MARNKIFGSYKIGVIDYRAGNLKSISNALDYLGLSYVISHEGQVLDKCERIIIPGVGAAGQAMENLENTGLAKWIYQWFWEGKPILGICLGSQIILERSEENHTPCLGLIEGTVRRLQSPGGDIKVPHMGWNAVHLQKQHPLFSGIPDRTEFYFAHSYHPEPEDAATVIGITDYGVKFCSALRRKNLAAVQFHPEKSGRWGLHLLSNFSKWKGTDVE
ncbi:MAG: imidazole glycerol phosphate synthase subunit HisH [Syntrophales bacterium]|nr:imidazole glycerol phosphate synthase subunit HisH [Syntrophales bacterium]